MTSRNMLWMLNGKGSASASNSSAFLNRTTQSNCTILQPLSIVGCLCCSPSRYSTIGPDDPHNEFTVTDAMPSASEYSLRFGVSRKNCRASHPPCPK